MNFKRILVPLALAPAGLLWQSTLATASALLLLLSFPTFDLSWLAWVALAPLLYALSEGVSWRRALWLGWLTGVLFTFFAENWIAHSMTHYGGLLTGGAYAVAFLFATVLALFPALFAAVLAQLLKRFGTVALACAPLVWVATEWLRPLVTGVTWNALGVSQARYFMVARLAQFGGVYFLSGLVVAGSAWLVLLFNAKERPVRHAASALLLFGALAFWLPAMQPNPPTQSASTINVLGVQPNIPVDIPLGDTTRYLLKTIALTQQASAGQPVDLTIWAECPLSLFYDNDEAVRQRINTLARESGSYFLINSVARTGDNGNEAYFNSVSTISPRPDAAGQQALQRYDKMRLVPFGEFVPWRFALGRFVPTITGDFTPGQQAVVNTLKLSTQRAALLTSETGGAEAPAIERTTSYVRTGAFICYEAAYPDLVRRFVQNGATLLVNVSEDGWFGPTAGARQHLAHARLRAIENNRDLVRVTNTGISALLTADGRVVDALPQFVEGTQRWQAQARSAQTFYTRHGDWFAVSAALATVILFGFSLRPGSVTKR
ncbi:MAG: apolipoprotein N-acyltransferase [Acidobacteria bacterium]|nr:apolipoprotein N-acyltransferase [Acidobacteriota bacterium]